MFYPNSYSPHAAKRKEGIFVFRYPSMIYFANVDRFVEQLYTKTVDPRTCKANASSVKYSDDAGKNGNGENGDRDDSKEQRAVVIDFSEVSYVDGMLLSKLYAVRAAYERVGISFSLARVNRSVVSRLRKVAGEMATSPVECYLTVQDAMAALSRNRKNSDDFVVPL